MNVLIMDDSAKRRSQIAGALQKKKYNVRACSGSQEFITGIEESGPDRILLDMKTWKQGRAIYQYFAIAKKLENIPIVFYNVIDGSKPQIVDREPHEKDRLLTGVPEVEDMVSILDQES